MGLIARFEDLIAWQKAREMRREVSLLARRPEFRFDTDLRSQIRRAALSVMSNIAEGFERNTTAQFCSFLNIAKSSAAEVQSDLYAALDDGFIQSSDFEKVYALASSANRLCGGLFQSVASRAGSRRSGA